jgi:hypothetical protein
MQEETRPALRSTLPHDYRIEVSAAVDYYVLSGDQVTDAVRKVADQLNVTPRTVHRARVYARNFDQVPLSHREFVRDHVNKSKSANLVQQLAESTEREQEELLAALASATTALEDFNDRKRERHLISESQVNLAMEVNGIAPDKSKRRHCQIQTLLAKCGEILGFEIWLPQRDRGDVLKYWSPNPGKLLEKLPLSFDKLALQTISEIDVLWVRKNAIRRAFEVEHTTSIFSGLLRMSDLVAQLPTTQFNLHIVAPESYQRRVLKQIGRPTFSVIEPPLRDSCTFLSFESVEKIAAMEHLDRTLHSIIESYAVGLEA